MNLEALGTMLLPTFAAMALSFVFTKFIRNFALAHKIVDDPSSAKRKIHKEPTALLGGVAIIGAIVVVVAATHPLTSLLGWIALSIAVLVIGGTLDDIFTLPAKTQILFPLLASCIIVFGAGIHIDRLPIPGTHTLEAPLAQIITVLWLLAMTYTTKLLDGLDGLATGIGAIGAATIALLALTATYFQPEIALIACITTGALLGFLAWNFNPAQIFLGEVGSEFIGFFLGVLSVMSGSKIATALLVVGIPMLDVIHVMFARVKAGKSPFAGDRKHLHFLLANRLGVRNAVYLLYALSAAFGLLTLSLQTQIKVIALIGVFLTAIALTVFASGKNKTTA